ncbi:MAG: antitoxin [Solirubrobacteraceae bacterium]
MAFSDKFKNLTKQAQEAVAEHKEKIHDAVDAVSVAADEKTHGKYTAKIAKYGQKATEAVEKLSGEATPDAGVSGDSGASTSPSVADAPAPAPAPAAPATSPSFADAPAPPTSPSFADSPASNAPSSGPTFDE